MPPLIVGTATKQRMGEYHIENADKETGDDAGNSSLPVRALPEYAQYQCRKQR